MADAVPVLAGEKNAPPVIDFTDRHDVELVGLQREHQETVTWLATALPRYAGLKSDGSAGADEEARQMAPRIVEAEKLVKNREQRIADAKAAIAENERQATEYRVRAAAAQERVTRSIDLLRGLDAELEWALTEQRRLDAEAAGLLASTGDRRAFRRPLVSPFQALRDALQGRLDHAERLRVAAQRKEIAS